MYLVVVIGLLCLVGIDRGEVHDTGERGVDNLIKDMISEPKR